MSLQEEAPAALDVPAGQSAQLTLPRPLNVPATHTVADACPVADV